MCSHSCLIGMFRAPLIEADAWFFFKKRKWNLLCHLCVQDL